MADTQNWTHCQRLLNEAEARMSRVKLREEMARALYEHDWPGATWLDVPALKDAYLARADAVLSLGLVRVQDVVGWLTEHREFAEKDPTFQGTVIRNTLDDLIEDFADEFPVSRKQGEQKA